MATVKSEQARLERTPKDEPVFLLRGQDILAPGIVELYADYTEAIRGQQEIVEEARKCAKQMRDWQRRRKVKVADL